MPNYSSAPVKLALVTLVSYYLKVTLPLIYLPFYTMCIMVSDTTLQNQISSDARRKMSDDDFETFFKLNFLGEKKILQEKGGET